MLKYMCFIILLSGTQLNDVASLTISPDHAHVTDVSPQNLIITCTADRPLAGCQFRILDSLNQASPVMELSRGSESQADPAHMDVELNDYSYSGRGLGAGDCGVSLTVNGTVRWMVACRARAEGGGWQYAWTDVTGNDEELLPLTLTPRVAVVLPGEEAKFMLKAQGYLNRCIFWLPANRFFVEIEADGGTTPSRAHFRHLGNGTRHGDCGIGLANVTEADNGPTKCYITDGKNLADFRFMLLIVARFPSAPKMSLVYTADDVTATCEVHDSRPVAKVTWILGEDRVVRQDEVDDSPATAGDEWRWPWMQGSILQRLTLPRANNGEALTCRVTHVAYTTPLETKEIITFP